MYVIIWNFKLNECRLNKSLWLYCRRSASFYWPRSVLFIKAKHYLLLWGKRKKQQSAVYFVYHLRSKLRIRIRIFHPILFFDFIFNDWFHWNESEFCFHHLIALLVTPIFIFIEFCCGQKNIHQSNAFVGIWMAPLNEYNLWRGWFYADNSWQKIYAIVIFSFLLFLFIFFLCLNRLSRRK